jgi:hypothetical protein
MSDLHLKAPDKPYRKAQYDKISRDVNDRIAVEQGALYGSSQERRK